MNTAAPRLTMADIRRDIDRIDEDLVKLLAERQRLVEQAIVVKKRDNIPARVPQRIEQVMGHIRRLAGAHHVDPALASLDQKCSIVHRQEHELDRKR
jgi:isochorismate pyruvate lyase